MALTVAQQAISVFGDKNYVCLKITGDGSTTTHTTSLLAIDSAWATSGDTTTSTAITWSGQTITFGTAITNAKYLYLHLIGA